MAQKKGMVKDVQGCVYGIPYRYTINSVNRKCVDCALEPEEVGFNQCSR